MHITNDGKRDDTMKFTQPRNNRYAIRQDATLPYQIPRNIQWDYDEYAKYLMRLKAENDQTFKRCFNPRYDITRLFHKRLYKKIYGPIPSHWIIYIRGLQGVDVGTGQYKSSIMMELMMLYDTQYTVEKIAFSNDEILEKVKTLVNANKPIVHTVFSKDESPQSLKHRSDVQLTTLTEAIRALQVSFIIVRPEMESLSMATFVIEPIMPSIDMKWVKCAIYVDGQGYIGFIILRIHIDNELWLAYKPYKDKYLDVVINQQTNNFAHKELAQRFMKTPQFQKCLKDNGKLVRIRLRKYVREVYPNITNDEARFTIDTIEELHAESGDDDE